MHTIAVARHAMATRFEVVLHGENPANLRAAGEEALDEIERLEAQLSLFQPTSEIAHLNAGAAQEPVRVTPALFAMLQQARRLHEETGGAFDPTIAPLMRCWGFWGGAGQVPSPDALSEARARVGMGLLQLNPEDFTVRFSTPGVMLDLGAIGKGYAIEKAAEVLREAGVTSALLHGGTSTVYGLGRPPDGECWKVAIEDPRDRLSAQNRPPLAIVPLQDQALSVSAVWGKCFVAGDRTCGHVIDPRTGEPAEAALLAAVALPSATETDALSTALLVLGIEGQGRLNQLRSEARTLLLIESGGDFQLLDSRNPRNPVCFPGDLGNNRL